MFSSVSEDIPNSEGYSVEKLEDIKRLGIIADNFSPEIKAMLDEYMLNMFPPDIDSPSLRAQLIQTFEIEYFSEAKYIASLSKSEQEVGARPSYNSVS